MSREENFAGQLNLLAFMLSADGGGDDALLEFALKIHVKHAQFQLIIY